MPSAGGGGGAADAHGAAKRRRRWGEEKYGTPGIGISLSELEILYRTTAAVLQERVAVGAVGARQQRPGPFAQRCDRSVGMHNQLDPVVVESVDRNDEPASLVAKQLMTAAAPPR